MTQKQRSPAIPYAAKSTEDKRGSIKTQLADCRKMAEREGWEVVGEYSDEAASAWSADRGPGLAAAMEHVERLAQEHGTAVLVVQHSDRLARGDARQARHLVEVVTWALKVGVTIRSVEDDLFADERVALLMAGVMGQRNTEDSQRKSLGTKAGLKRRAEKGLYTGRRPCGYDKVDGALVKNQTEVEVVQRIFAEYVAGRSMVTIARGLHQDRIPTTTGTATWRTSTVSGVLRNPLYIGKVRSHDELYEGQHPAIIDDETWRRTCDLFAARGPNKGRGRPPRGHHLFRNGKLRCGKCGDAMVPRTKTKPTWQEYYCCTGHIQLGNDYCTQGCVPRAVVDQSVYEHFEQAALDAEATRRQVAESRDRKLKEVRALLADAEHEDQRARERRARVRRDYTEGKLTVEEWHEFEDELGGEQEAAEAEVARLAQQEQEAETWGDLQDVEAEVLRKLTDIRRAIAGELNEADGLDAVRATLDRLFERFTLHVDGDEGRIDPIARSGPSWTVDEELRPVLRPTPLDLAGNNEQKGSGCL